MPIGRVNTGGGGGSFAMISAIYPAGSICTCSDGVKTLKAKDTSGKFIFSVPYAATWTVSSTNGTQSASQTVVIDAQFQLKNVTLQYNLYIFTEGAGVPSNWVVTAGGASFGDVTAQRIRFGSTDAYGSAYVKVVSVPSFVLSAFSVLKFEAYTNKVGAKLGITPTAGGGAMPSFVTTDALVRKVYSIDISAITDSTPYYIECTSEVWPVETLVYNIWLE